MEIKINNKVRYLNQVLCEVERIYQSLLASAKISDSEYVLLFALLELGEGCSQKDIVESSYISKKTINSTVKKLQQEGIIRLEAGKYPNMHIYLTPKGSEYIKSKMIPLIERENEIMQHIQDSDFEVFVSQTAKYLNVFKNNV